MMHQLKFRPDTLQQLDDTWTVQGVMRQSEDQYSVRIPCIVIPDSVAAWLQALQKVIIRERETSNRAVAKPYLATDYYQCDVLLDDDIATVSKVYPNLNPGTVTGNVRRQAEDGNGSQFGELHQAAKEIRALLEEYVWPEVLRTFPSERYLFPPESGVTASAGMCWISSLATAEILKAVFPEGKWQLAGGHPVAGYEHLFRAGTFRPELNSEDGGLLSQEGLWCGHEWVQGTYNGEDVILDLTGDQFGLSEITISTLLDNRYRSNYSAEKLIAGTSDRRVEMLIEAAVGAWNEHKNSNVRLR